MKTKRNLYILFPCVVIIWGALIYKFVDTFDSESFELNNNVTKLSEKPVIKKKDSFSLLEITRDPFLDITYKEEKINNISQKNSNQLNEIEWPTVEYLGKVKDSKGSKTIYLLSINGKEFLFNNGETIEDFTLVNSKGESINLKYKESIKRLKYGQDD